MSQEERRGGNCRPRCVGTKIAENTGLQQGHGKFFIES